MSQDALELERTRSISEDLDVILDSVAQKNPDLYQALLLCAVPHWFDTYVLREMLLPDSPSSTEVDILLQQMSQMAFFKTNPYRGWQISVQARKYLLSKAPVRERLKELHQRAAGIFATIIQLENLKDLPWKERLTNADFKNLEAERVYHLLCINPKEGLKIIFEDCARALGVIVTGNVEVIFCYEFLGSIDWDVDLGNLEGKRKLLQDGINELMAYHGMKALDLLETLEDLPELDDLTKASLQNWVGSIYMREGNNSEKARPHLEIACKLNDAVAMFPSEVAELHYTKGLLEGRLDLADQYAQAAIRAEPGATDGYVAMGMVYQTKGDLDEAISWFLKAQEKDPSNTYPLWCLSTAYSLQQKEQQAIEMLDRIVALDPKQAWNVLYRKGDLYLNARHYPLAIQMFEKAVQDFPDRADNYIGLGNYYSATGRSELAEKNYRIAMDKDPDSLVPITWLVSLYQKQGKFTEAINECLGAHKRGLQLKDIYLWLIILYSALGLEEEVRKIRAEIIAYDAAESIAQRCAEGDDILIKVQTRQDSRDENLRKAEESYRSAQSEDPHVALPYLGLADLAVLRYDQPMVSEQRKLLKERAPWAEYSLLTNLGPKYSVVGDFTRAEAILREAITLNPEGAEAWTSLRDVYTWTGNLAGFAEVERALDTINPTLGYDTRVIEGDTAFSLGEYSLAKAIYERTSQYAVEKGMDHDQATLELSIASIENMAENNQAAIAACQRAAALSPDLAAAAYARIAAFYRELQDFREAFENANLAIRLDPSQVNGYLEIAYQSILQANKEQLDDVIKKVSSNASDRLYDFRLGLADFYLFYMNNTRVARRYYQVCHLDQPERVEPLIGLAMVEMALKRRYYHTAQAYLDQAIALDYHNLEVYRALSDLYLKQGLIDKVLEVQERLMRIAPYTQYQGWLAIGAAYEKKKDFARAEQFYRQAAEAHPNQVDALAMLVPVLMQLGRTEDARNVCQQAKDKAGGYLNLGRYFINHSRPDEAHYVYHMGIEEEPPEKRPDLYIAAAQLHLNTQNVPQAIEEVEKVIADYPNNAQGFITRAEIDDSLEKPQAAETWLRQSLETVEDKAIIYWQLGQRIEGAGDPDQAIELYQKAVNEKPGPDIESTIYEHLADLLIIKRDYDAASKYLLRSVELSPVNAGAYFSLGNSYRMLGDDDKALEMYQKATQILPKYVEALLWQGILLMNKDKKEKALEAFQQVVALERNEFAYAYMGKIYFSQEKHDLAESSFRTALQIVPTDYEPHYYLGMIFEIKGDFKQAARRYRKASKLAPELLDTIYALARVYGKTGNKTGITRIVKDISRSFTDQPFLPYDVRASFFYFAGNLIKAERIYREAIEALPNIAIGYQALVQLLRDQQRIAEATEILNAMKGKAEPDYVLWMLEAEIMANLHRFSEAEHAYAQAMEMEPEESAGNAMLNFSNLLLAEGKPDACIQLLQKGKDLIPEVASFAYNGIGRAFLLKEEYSQAREAFVKATEINPLNSDAFFNLGNIQTKEYQLVEAEASYRKAIESNPENGEIYLALAHIYGQQKNVKALSELEDTILKVDPGSQYEAHLIIAAAYREAKFYDELAIEQLNKAVMLDPQRYEAYEYLASLYDSQQRWTRAREAYLKAGELYPENLYLYLVLVGKIFCKEENYAEAEKTFRKALEIAPKGANVYRVLGEFYIDRENWEAAIALYQRMTKLDLEEGSSGYLYLASIYRTLGNKVAMRKICRRLISRIKSVVSPHPVLVRRLGLAHMVCGEFEEAAKFFEESLERDPSDVQATFYLAVAKSGMGKLEESKEIFERGLNLVKSKDDLTFPIEEAQVLAEQKPEVAGTKELYQEFLKLREKLPQLQPF